MAKFDIKALNCITAGKTQNTFNVCYCYTDDGAISEKTDRHPAMSVDVTETFFGNIGEKESMLKKHGQNIQSLYEVDNGIILHNLYSRARVKVKCASKNAKKKNFEYYQPIMSGDYVGMAQFRSYAYALTEPTVDSYMYLSVSGNDVRPFEYSYVNVLSGDKIDTFLYPKPEDIEAAAKTYKELIDDNRDLSDEIMYKIFQTKRNLRGVEYNYLVEFPEGNLPGEYENGYIQGDVNVMKNHLDYKYDMDVDKAWNLSCAREYCGIDVCGQSLYAKYRDNVDYAAGSKYEITYVYPERTVDDGLLTSVVEINVAKRRTEYSYQHVEIINSINKYDNNSKGRHKASLFSIRINGYGFNDFEIDEKVKEKLRQNVKNNLKTILETVTPANTQLFDIYYTGV